jgi:hypothetical protein
MGGGQEKESFLHKLAQKVEHKVEGEVNKVEHKVGEVLKHAAYEGTKTAAERVLHKLEEHLPEKSKKDLHKVEEFLKTVAGKGTADAKFHLHPPSADINLHRQQETETPIKAKGYQVGTLHMDKEVHVHVGKNEKGELELSDIKGMSVKVGVPPIQKEAAIEKATVGRDDHGNLVLNATVIDGKGHARQVTIPVTKLMSKELALNNN